MSDFTPRANLRLPGGGSTGTILPDEQVDIDVLNDNFRKIDALLGARNIPSASSYSGSMDGDLVYARDTEFLHMFSTTAGGLITPRLPGSKMFSGTRAEREAFTGARDGDMWRDTDNIGIIWAYKAGSPGTWEYSGNKCRGTKADILQTGTDGIAVPGMIAFCTDDNSDYVRFGSTWRGGFGVIGAGSSGVTLAASLLKNNGDGTAKLVLRANHATNLQGATIGSVPTPFLPSVVWAGIASSSLGTAGNQSCSLRIDASTGVITVLGLTAASTSVWASFDYPLAVP